ncbi:unnamed protein product [Fraxinus pennsylvanica]|uniref:factor independent urate hydroxylase n=1 Tax=Fraxinus pennsylvanica TaxID=56036 RepID=A0AAD1ZPD7_9LAMI|nr:unnamed protein product [Fraxinus pennsylvanica]
MDVKKVLVDTFFGHLEEGVYNPSIQSSLYYMAKAVLGRSRCFFNICGMLYLILVYVAQLLIRHSRFPDISSVQLKMPNIHFLPVSLSSKDNPVIFKFEDDVYLSTDEPHGSIEASLTRMPSKM